MCRLPANVTTRKNNVTRGALPKQWARAYDAINSLFIFVRISRTRSMYLLGELPPVAVLLGPCFAFSFRMAIFFFLTCVTLASTPPLSHGACATRRTTGFAKSGYHVVYPIESLANVPYAVPFFFFRVLLPQFCRILDKISGCAMRARKGFTRFNHMLRSIVWTCEWTVPFPSTRSSSRTVNPRG